MTRDLTPLVRTLNRIANPSARKSVIMSKWERDELTANEAERLIHLCGLVAA